VQNPVYQNTNPLEPLCSPLAVPVELPSLFSLLYFTGYEPIRHDLISAFYADTIDKIDDL
jgi:hypothetical protein